MSLFAILGIPCFTVLLLVADRKPGIAQQIFRAREVPALEFVKGFFYAIPSLVVILLLRRYVPLLYRSFPLYLLPLLSDHLIPVVFLIGLYFLVFSSKTFSELLPFGGGFYTLLTIVEIFSHYGEYEPYHLFLLPAIRMAGLLFLTLFFLRCQELYGLLRGLFILLLVLIPFLSAAITFLYMRSYLLWAVVITGMLFVGSLIYTYFERRS
jgi:hypothetical protein